MHHINIKSLGPIKEADVTFGDLTLLVGPQASGKSIFLQLLKLALDKNHIRKTLEQYNFIWGKDSSTILDRFFGEGMHGIWKPDTEIVLDGTRINDKFLIGKKGERYKSAEETMFYTPAQRIVSIVDGRPKFFTEFDSTVPYVLRYFSETLRQLMQNELDKKEAIFPQSQRLKEPLRNSFNDSIFHDAKIIIDKVEQKRFKLQVDGLSIPFMVWSAGQKEFMPLLLSFYWLCPASKTSRRDAIKYVVIEEPEMGLHPQAIESVILQVIDLLSRDYKVIISTHSPVLIEFAWAFNLLKSSKANDDALFDLFELKKTGPTKRLFQNILSSKTIRSYHFDRKGNEVHARDISSLDAGSEDANIAEWGGLSRFARVAADVVTKYDYEEDR